MSTAPGRLAHPAGGMHPVVLNRRLHWLMLVGLSVLIPLAIGLAISFSDSNPSVLLAVAVVLGAVGVVALVLNRRLEVSVVALVLYLGLLLGPIKLGTGGHEAASVMRDVLIFAVVLGAFLRLLASRKPLSPPPLSGWVFAFVGLVLVEALNPKTHGLTKALGGFRQQLEWVPFFFFGYALIRSKRRFRQMFLVIGVIALANGVISTYQSRLSPGQLASWGPGYRELAYGSTTEGSKTGITGRSIGIEGQARVRPPGLGADAGFSGGIGALALPCTLALLAALGRRRRWPVVLLCLGALAGVATGLGRLQVVGAVLSIVIFMVLAFTAGRSISRPLKVMLTVIAITIPVGAVFVSAVGSGTFSRYNTILEGSSSNNDGKVNSLKQVPKIIERDPFGIGLGTVGAATGFGGIAENEGIEQTNASAETQYNFVVDELGLPGLILWVALSIRLIVLGVTRTRRIGDLELRLDLAAVFAILIGFTIIGLGGPTMSSPAFGPFFWLTAGISSYWFITRPREMRQQARSLPSPPATVGVAGAGA